jgi:DNA-binding NarL/FixJ family response regulator
MKIVIVDDSESIRKVLRAICEGEGHEVVAEFGDGMVLLDYVVNHRPDVVCLDFDLPGANGLELLVQLDVTANNVDVVMITGSDDPELQGHAADLGATGFIRKPFEQERVIDELKAIRQTRAIAARAAAMPEAGVPVAAPPPVEAAATSVIEEPALPVPPPPPVAIDVVPRSAVVVDDSGSIRLLLKGILEEIGVKVIGTASNARDGVEAVRKARPALVCLDVDMPGMSGLEALPQIRLASPKTKVVMITGNAGRAIVEAAVSGGAKGYFLKPIRPAKVEEFMKKLLG